MNFQTFQDVQQPEESAKPEATPDQTPIDDAGLDESPVGEKKPAVDVETLVLAGVLLVCGAVLYLMYQKNRPAAAAAPAASGLMVADFLSHGDQHVPSLLRTLSSTDEVVAKFSGYPSRPQVPLTALHSNPFRQLAGRESGVEVPDSEAMRQRRRETERADALHAAQAMQLQSVLHGPHDACVINNAMYIQGQEVGGFVIEQITADSVIVHRGPYRFELLMSR